MTSDTFRLRLIGFKISVWIHNSALKNFTTCNSSKFGGFKITKQKLKYLRCLGLFWQIFRSTLATFQVTCLLRLSKFYILEYYYDTVFSDKKVTIPWVWMGPYTLTQLCLHQHDGQQMSFQSELCNLSSKKVQMSVQTARHLIPFACWSIEWNISFFYSFSFWVSGHPFKILSCCSAVHSQPFEIFLWLFSGLLPSFRNFFSCCLAIQSFFYPFSCSPMISQNFSVDTSLNHWQFFLYQASVHGNCFKCLATHSSSIQ